MEKNTFIKMPLNNDTVVDLTINYFRLYKIQQVNQEAYDDWFRISEYGPKDDFDVIKYLFVGYLCANYDKEDCITDFEQFLDLVPFNRMIIFATYNRLRGFNLKKKSSTEKHSSWKGANVDV